MGAVGNRAAVFQAAVGALLSVHQSGSVHGDRTYELREGTREFQPLDGTLPSQLQILVEWRWVECGPACDSRGKARHEHGVAPFVEPANQRDDQSRILFLLPLLCRVGMRAGRPQPAAGGRARDLDQALRTATGGAYCPAQRRAQPLRLSTSAQGA